SEMLSSDASASIEINPVHHCTPYDQQLPVSPYPCKGLHPEVRAKRASKDAGRGASASPFEAQLGAARRAPQGEENYDWRVTHSGTSPKRLGLRLPGQHMIHTAIAASGRPSTYVLSGACARNAQLDCAAATQIA